MTYTVPKPKPSVALWLLAALVVIGLAALFLAALAAFKQIMPVYQAVFAAILIEAGMVVDAIALVRGRNWIAAAGMAVSLSVSLVYNFIQAQAAGAGLHPVMLLALAVGPLSALSFLAMATGRELAMHEKRVIDWAERRQRWTDRRADKAAQVRAAEPATSRQLAATSARLDWRNLPIDDRDLIATMSTAEIVAKYNLPERTARNWRELAQKNGYHKQEVVQ